MPAEGSESETMVVADVLARRLLVLNECLAELERPECGQARSLVADAVLRAAVERWMQVAIDSACDMAYHLAAAEGWTPPTSARDAFRVLAGHGRIAIDLADRLGLAAGLRNILVHEYAAIDLELVARAVREDLGDLRAFAAQAATWLGPTA